MHLADDFIQNDLRFIFRLYIFCQYVFMSPANIMEQDQECKIAMTEIFPVPFVRNKNETWMHIIDGEYFTLLNQFFFVYSAERSLIGGKFN